MCINAGLPLSQKKMYREIAQPKVWLRGSVYLVVWGTASRIFLMRDVRRVSVVGESELRNIFDAVVMVVKKWLSFWAPRKIFHVQVQVAAMTLRLKINFLRKSRLTVSYLTVQKMTSPL